MLKGGHNSQSTESVNLFLKPDFSECFNHRISDEDGGTPGITQTIDV